MFAATIALAKEAGLTAVAVGIETNRQLALARELDCAVGQGFLLHGPASPDRVRLRGASRVGNVRAMASSGATARQRQQQLSDDATVSRPEARRRDGGGRAGRGRHARGAGIGLHGRAPAAGDRRARLRRPALRGHLAGDRDARRARWA